MGVDLLDLRFRVEHEFGVDPAGEPLRRIAIQRQPPDITAGELHDLICDLCRAAGTPVPSDSWRRLTLILSAVSAVDPSEITKESGLIHDLGME